MISKSIYFLLLILNLNAASNSICMPNCTCFLDLKGRNTVLCKDGGMVGPLTLTHINPDTEVLRITAPDDNSNELTMSPVFTSYKNLEEIYITHSNIPQLGMHFFYGLTKLDILDLSQNNITQPLDHNFRGLSKLKELYLDDNRICSLPSGTFKYLHELRLLSLQRNRITELMPRIFLEIKKLKVLKMSGNSLGYLDPVVFEDVRELRTFECRGCGLKKINRQVFELLPHLTHLDVGDNELSFIGANDLEPLANLKILKLDGNHISIIKDPIFVFLTELKRLSLARNFLSHLKRKIFENLHNLTELDLGRNKFEQFEDDVFQPISDTLEVLNLSGNHLKIHILKPVLENLRISELHLESCEIIEISDQIFPPTLKVLNLANNHLSSIPVEVIPDSLQELDISWNRFRGLKEHVLGRLDSLKIFRLEKNPWSCDLCHIVPLLERANRTTSISEAKCVFPFTQEGKKLSVINRKELTWCTVPTYTSSDANFFLLGDEGKVGLIAASTSICLLILTVVVIVVAILYSRRHAARYYTHEDKLAMEADSVYENQSPLFGDERELSFKFPLDNPEKKLSVSTIDEIRKEHPITNGT